MRHNRAGDVDDRRSCTMNESPGHFESRLADLLDKLETLPPEQQARLRPLVEATRARQAQLAQNAVDSQNALTDWRIARK